MIKDNANYEICPTCVMDNESGIQLEVDQNGECRYSRGYQRGSVVIKGEEGKAFVKLTDCQGQGRWKRKGLAGCIIGLVEE